MVTVYAPPHVGGVYFHACSGAAPTESFDAFLLANRLTTLWAEPVLSSHLGFLIAFSHLLGAIKRVDDD